MPEPFTTLTAIAAPLPRENVDTDAIFPARFGKTVQRTGLGHTLFANWRYLPDGSEDPDFVLNHPAYRGARILVTGANFGCGSSREHAPWALHGFGIRAIIAESFADIFHMNCIKNGMLPVALPKETVAAITAALIAQPGVHMTVDLIAERVVFPGGEARFHIDPHARRALLEALDDIELTLQRRGQIDAFERRQAARQPWLAVGVGRLPARETPK